MNCVTPSIFPRPTVRLIVNVLALKSIAFHLIPITSSRLNPYTPEITIEKVKEVISKLREVHPYEEPAIDITHFKTKL